MNEQFFSNIDPGTLFFYRFKLIKCIAASDLGGVYLCEDKKNPGRRVALKIISSTSSIDSVLSESFYREMTAAQKIRHPNVLKSHNFFRDEDFTAFTMDYIEGGSLAELLEKKQRLSIKESFRILQETCRGLQAIHEAGVIHRDLKPENILLCKDKSVKIADFGIASINQENWSTRSIVGTLNYLSPEYLRDGTFDERSDIYALGIIGYELLTGVLPFQGESFLETITLRVKLDPPHPRFFRLDCPKDLEDVVLKAMHRNPNRRHSSAKAMLAALNETNKSQASSIRLVERVAVA